MCNARICHRFEFPSKSCRSQLHSAQIPMIVFSSGSLLFFLMNEKGDTPDTQKSQKGALSLITKRLRCR